MQQIEVKVENDHIQRITTAKPIAAISELIWNAYDADAREVRVELEEGQLTKLGVIRIVDDGTGIPADEVETEALRALSEALSKAPEGATAEELQTIIYDVGRANPRYQDLNAKGATPEKPGVSNAWFGAIYEVLLGEEKGPRFGSFVALYGVPETRALIAKALAGDLVKAA